MKDDVWNLFPFSTLADLGDGPHFTSGSVIPLADACRDCPTLECMSSSSANNGISECRYGMNWHRLDADRLIVGLVVTDSPMMTARVKKRNRQHPELRVKTASLNRAVSNAAALGPAVVQDFMRARRKVADQLRTDPDTIRLVADDLRKDFEKSIDQSHDFMQLAKLIKGHVETLLQSKYPDLPTEEAAERLRTEGAIYFSTELMLMKLDALTYLDEPNQAFDSPARFKVHPYLLKYCRIYNWRARQKELALSLEGSCYAYSNYSAKAVGVVFQGLLDNLVKYAPAGSSATIRLDEGADVVDLTFSSLGPRIEDDERMKIFLPGYRARAARSVAAEGMGVGLATAKSVSDILGLQLDFHQSSEPAPRFRDRFETTFTIRMSKAGSYAQ